MSVLSTARGAIKRVSTRAWIIIGVVVLLIASTAGYVVVKRYLTPQPEPIDLAKQQERANRYISARGTYGGALQSVDVAASEVVVKGPEGEKRFRYSDTTEYGKGLSYAKTQLKDIAPGTQVVVTHVNDTLAEFIWVP